jgi:hypothetical protein
MKVGEKMTGTMKTKYEIQNRKEHFMSIDPVSIQVQRHMYKEDYLLDQTQNYDMD